jgi:hypothetical protein
MPTAKNKHDRKSAVYAEKKLGQGRGGHRPETPHTSTPTSTAYDSALTYSKQYDSEEARQARLNTFETLHKPGNSLLATDSKIDNSSLMPDAVTDDSKTMNEVIIDIADFEAFQDEAAVSVKSDLTQRKPTVPAKRKQMMERSKKRDAQSLRRGVRPRNPLVVSESSFDSSVTINQPPVATRPITSNSSPPLPNRKCYNCGELGHYAQACARPKTAQRVPTVVDPPQSAEPATPKPLVVNLLEIEANMFSKASLAWLTKDPNSAADRSVVILSLTNIARKEKLHLCVPPVDVHEVVMRVHERAFRAGIDARLQTVEALTYSDKKIKAADFAERFVDAFSRYIRLIDIAPIRGTTLKKLKTLENLEPLSRHKETFTIALFFALTFRMFLVPLFEESFKRAGHLLEFHSASGATTWDYWDLIPVAVLTLLETYHSNHHRLAHSICEFLVRLPIHYLMSQLQFMFGLFLHIFWNVAVIVSHCFFGTDTIWLLDSFRATKSLRSTIYQSVCVADHAMTLFPIDPRFKCKPGEVSCKESFGCEQHWGISGLIPTVYTACTHNEECAMNGRVGKKVPSADKEWEVNRFWNKATRVVGHVYSKVKRVKKGMEINKWSANYPPAKRDRLRALHRDGFDMPPLTASSFVKREIAIVDTDQTHKKLKDPRFIQGCPEELNVVTGPYIKILTKNVKKALAPRAFVPSEIRAGKQVIYMCGSNAEQVGQHLASSIQCVESVMDDDDSIVFIEDDESRFDLHIRKGAFDSIHSLYKTTLPPHIKKLLLRRLSKGRTAFGTKYTIPYTMQSGWPDTSLADTVANATMKYFIHGVGKNWISIVMGDDSVTVTTKKTLASMGGVEGVKKAYESFGMEIEIVIKEHVLDVEMCSSRFYPVGDTFVLMAKPGKRMATALTDLRKRNPQNSKSWIRGVAVGLNHAGLIDPLMHALATGIAAQVPDGPVLIERNEYKILHTTNLKSSWLDSCVYYDHHYGLSEAMLLSAIGTLNSITLGEQSNDSILLLIAQKDCLGI